MFCRMVWEGTARITALALDKASFSSLVTESREGKAIPGGRKVGLCRLALSAVASRSVRAHSFTGCPLRASIIPSVVPQLVVPITVILGISYTNGSSLDEEVSTLSPSRRSLPEINLTMLSRCKAIISTVPIKV